MNRVESIRQRTSRLITIPFFDFNTLSSACHQSLPLLHDMTLQMCPGINATSPNGSRYINGQFGIKKYDSHTAEEVAVCGFDIEKNEMVIRHTPQAKKPEEFSSPQVRNRLGRSDFRIEMMETMIEIAKRLRLKGVVGFPVRPSLLGKFQHDVLRMKGKNQLFELFNFQLKNQGQANESYYYLDLV